MPTRTCLICRKKADSSAFFRFSVVGGELVFDSGKRKNTGRGGYICRDEKQLDALLTPKIAQKIGYFLKTSAPKISPERIETQKKVLSFLEKKKV